MAELDALNNEMKDAGAWVFAAGPAPGEHGHGGPVEDGEVLITDGPYVEGKEHLGGFTIINAADLDAALEWGRRLARRSSRLPIEVRPAVFRG